MLSEPDFKEKKIILIFPHLGDKLSFKNDNLVVKDCFDKIKVQISCYKIFALFIAGGVSLTSGIISRSRKFGFSICLFNAYFKLYSTINFALEGNTLLRKKQYTTENGNNIAKQIIINKLINQKNTLKKIRDKDSQKGVEIISANLKKLLNEPLDLNEIMGIEGICAKVYFNRLYIEYDWNGRAPRIKRDEINLLLDIAYTVLFNYIEAILNIYGFDIYKGNLHQEFYKRKSLVCDIIEPFRPIVDYKIRKMLNLGQLKNYNFIVRNSQYQLEWEDSSRFIMEILTEIAKYKTDIFRFIQRYYRWFMKDRSIADFPQAEINNDID